MGIETHFLYSYAVLLLTAKCYGLPIKEHNHINQLNLFVKGQNDDQELNLGGIESNVQSQKSLDQTLLQEANPIDQNTLDFVFQSLNQSDIWHNNKLLNINNTATEVNTEQEHGWKNQNTSSQELMQNRNNTVNETNSVRKEELDILIKRVFGSNSRLKNDSSKKREHKQDVSPNLYNDNSQNKTNVTLNFLKEVFGKNWDKENKPIIEENFDTIYKSENRYPTDEANSQGGDKPVEQFFRDVFGDNWDIENKPISQDNLDTSLNFVGLNSKVDKTLHHTVEDEQSVQGAETSLFENKYDKQDWGRDYTLPDVRPDGKDFWPYRRDSGYPTWIKHNNLPDIQRDRVDFLGNSLDSEILYQNGLETDYSTCDSNHNDRELLIDYKTRLGYSHYHPDRQNHRHFGQQNDF